MDNKNDLKTRLAALLKEKGLNETTAAKLANTSQSTLHRVITGDIVSPRAQTIEKLANALGVSYSYLVSGNEPPPDVITLNYDEQMERLQVPLFEWSQIENNDRSTPIKYIFCPEDHGPNTFATRVKDNTMTAQYGRSYPEGSIIFVDSDKVNEAKHGDRIIAALEGNIFTFKKYGLADDGQEFLESINLQYPIITREFEIKGLVIGMWIPE